MVCHTMPRTMIQTPYIFPKLFEGGNLIISVPRGLPEQSGLIAFLNFSNSLISEEMLLLLQRNGTKVGKSSPHGP